MKNTSFFSLQLIFFDLASLKEAKQSVHNFVGFALTIISLKMISRELLGLTDLTRIQNFCIHKLIKVIILYKYQNFVFVALQIVKPGIENFNNG